MPLPTFRLERFSCERLALEPSPHDAMEDAVISAQAMRLTAATDFMTGRRFSASVRFADRSCWPAPVATTDCQLPLDLASVAWLFARNDPTSGRRWTGC